MEYTFITLFWGQQFLDYFRQICLPSLLAPANLPAWPWKQQSRFVCYCPEAEWLHLQLEPAWQKLASFMTVAWQPLLPGFEPPPPDDFNKYPFKGECCQVAIADCRQRGSAAVFIVPDALYANGFVQALAGLIAQGTELVFHLGARVNEAVLDPLELYREASALTVAPETAVDLMLQYLHPDYQSCFWLAERCNWASPMSTFYWHSAQELVGRSLIVEPLYLKEPLLFPEGIPKGGLDNPQYLAQYQAVILEQGVSTAVVGGNPMVSLSVSPAGFYGYSADWYRFATTAERQGLIYQQLRKKPVSLLNRWFYAQTVVFSCSKPIDMPWATAMLEQYQPLLPQAPWDAPLLTVTVEDLWLQRNDAAILHAWQFPETRALLDGIENPLMGSLFYCIAQTLFGTVSWDEYTDFVRTYALPLRQFDDTHSLVKRPYPNRSVRSPAVMAGYQGQHKLRFGLAQVNSPLPNTLQVWPLAPEQFGLHAFGPNSQICTGETLFYLISQAASIEIEVAAKPAFVVWLLWALLEEKTIVWNQVGFADIYE